MSVLLRFSMPGQKALIVDTDLKVCEALAVMLKGEGIESDIHQHGQNILRQLEGERYCLAFIEIALPACDGLELARTLKKEGRVEDCVFMSTVLTLEDALKAIKLGACDYLKKPFKGSDLKLLFERLGERILLQKRIAEAELNYYALLQSIPLLIFTIDRLYSLKFINQACVSLLGYTPEEAIATPGWLLLHIHPADRVRVRQSLQASFERGSPFSLECRMLHRKGADVHGIIRSIPGMAGSGPLEGFDRIEVVFIDITDRVYLERALVQNEKLKTLGAVSSEMAHEVRNPLMSIAGFARRLVKKAPDMPEVGIILRESLRLEKVLDRIRDYLKPIQAQPRECRVAAVLADCLDQLFPEMKERGIWCQLELAEALPNASADPDFLRQVFLNLLRYALMAMHKEETVIIRTTHDIRSVHVEFRRRLEPAETIDPEVLFMPFDEGSQGYGLPLSYRLLKDMGGMLAVRPESGDAVFSVTLPRLDAWRLTGLETPGTDMPGQTGCFDLSTGLLARPRFEDLFERMLRSMAREKQPLSLALLCPIPGPAPEVTPSETVLSFRGAFASTLSQALHDPCALLADFNDDLFVVLMPATDATKARNLCALMQKAIHDSRLILPGSEQAVGLAVGCVCVRPSPSDTSGAIVAKAAEALSEACHAGPNSLTFLDN